MEIVLGHQFHETLFDAIKAHTLLDDEYIDEKSGEVYCKKCKTSKTVCIPEHSRFFVGKNTCACKQEKILQKEEFLKKQRMMDYYKKLTKDSLIEKRFEDVAFETIDKDRPKDFLVAIERCKMFVEKWEQVKERGQGFYLFGDVGTGKTLLTACLGKELLKKLVPVMFTSFIEISKNIRDTYRPTSMETESYLIDNICAIDLLIIDDIGKERVKKNGDDTFLQEKVYDIINSRYENRKPTIFTSNYSMAQLLEERGMDECTVDRINEMSAAVMELRGESYRNKLSATKAVF